MQKSFFLPRAGAFCRLVMGTFLLALTVFGVTLVGPFGASLAHANGGAPQFGLQPVLYDPADPLTKSYFIFDSKPGIVLKSQVRVINSGTATGSVSLYPVDATTGQTSGAVYLNHDDPRKDVGSWMTLGAQQLTLAPGKSQVVSFQVTIPRSVRQGQHLGGIVAENLGQSDKTPSPKPTQNTTFRINIKNLTIIAVQINLPGTPVEQLAATGVRAGGQGGYQQLFVGLSNTGTVMIKPYGSLHVADAQGHEVENLSLKLDTFLPQTAINYPVTITGPALGVGDYQATVDLTYGHNQALHYTTKFSIVQQQVTQVFGSNKTQAPTELGGADVLGLPLWQLLLVLGAGLAIFWVGGTTLYRRLGISRAKAKKSSTRSSQFKKPMF